MGNSILVHGSLAYDLFFSYPGDIKNHLIRNTEELYVNLRALGPEKYYGGCAGNVACTAALFGISPVVSSWIGKDGKEYLEVLKTKGVDISQIHVDPACATPTAVLIKDKSDNQWIVFGEPERPVNWELPALDDVGLAVVTSGMPERTVRLVRQIQSNGIALIIDPGKMIADMPSDSLMFCIETADYLVLNRYELNLLASKTGLSADEILSAPGTAIITDGGKGAEVHAEGRPAKQISAAPAEKIVDLYGAGDAFLGGFSAALFMGKSINEAVKSAAVAAAYAIESPGSQNHVFTIEQFQQRCDSVSSC